VLERMLLLGVGMCVMTGTKLRSVDGSLDVGKGIVWEADATISRGRLGVAGERGWKL
jgi:hypothetical protein